jgi:cysteine desulfurase
MIYAEYNGSCPLLPSVREYLKKRFDSELFGNPNAIHSIGQKLSKGMQKCRETIAGTFGCFPDQIFFNSGSSEGISQIFHSILEQTDKQKNIIITSPIEHSIIPNALSYYQERKGFLIKYVDIDDQGRVLVESLERLLQVHQGKIAMVTIMAVNNETGVYQPYKEIAKLCRKNDVKYFCDTTQLIGKGHFHFEESGLDYAVCSGHKLGALPGTGFLIVREPSQLIPLIFGSTQEKGLRGGTQNYLGIETLAVAVKDFQENAYKLEQLQSSKLQFEDEIKNAFPDVVIMGEKAPRLAGTTLIGYPGVHGQAIQIELESNDIFVTTSAACMDNQPETSKVLKAMGINDRIGRGVIRISLTYSQGDSEYSTIARILKETYTKLSKIQSF